MAKKRSIHGKVLSTVVVRYKQGLLEHTLANLCNDVSSDSLFDLFHAIELTFIGPNCFYGD